MINVVIADDHQMFIDGIESLLVDVDNIHITGHALNGKEVLSLLGEAPVDLVLMDINMPIMDGIEATLRIREEYPSVRVLILSMHNDREMIARILEAGAAGYILKNTGKDELLNAINHVYEGDNYFSAAVSNTIMRGMMGGRASEEQEPDVPITRRERDVLCGIVNELTTAEIADDLNISKNTVESHRKNLLSKTGVRNTAGLVRWALENGIC